MKSNDRDNTESLITEDEIDLREVFLLLWNNRYVISAVSFGFAFMAALVSFLILTPQYESSAVIMPSKSSGAGGLSSLASQSGLGAFLNLAGGDQEVSRFVEILKSRDLAEKVLSEEQMLKFIADPKDIPELGTLDYRKMRERLVKGLQGSVEITNQGNVIEIAYQR